MSNTDDLEAKARAWLQTRNLIALVPAEENEQSRLLITMLAAFDRSLAQPPSSEVVEAGDLLASLMDAGIPAQQKAIYEWLDAVRPFRTTAIAAHPKDPAPTVERIMEVVDIWRRSDGRNVMNAGEEREAMENCINQEWVFLPDLRTRLKTLFP